MVAVHFPVNTADREFSQNDADLLFPWQRILLYKKFEEVMDSLPTPAVLSCRSSTRASALLTCYKAVKQGLSKDQAMQWAQQNGKLFFPFPRPFHPSPSSNCIPFDSAEVLKQ
jgi:hypothetical protein